MLIQIPLRWSHVLSFAAGFMVACMVASFLAPLPSTAQGASPDAKIAHIEQMVQAIYAVCPWIDRSPQYPYGHGRGGGAVFSGGGGGSVGP